MTVNISSSAEWSQIIKSSNVVIADFYADWCGPCKMIAPTFESLSVKYSKPGRITFVKVNVDNQPAVAQSCRVRAMPTFVVLHNGSPVETVQGANPPALSAAVEKAVKLAGSVAPGASFGTPGRTLGGAGVGSGSGSGSGSSTGARGPTGSGQSLQRPLRWDLNSLINSIIIFFGLYFSSLFSLDPYKAAEASKYNINNPPATGPINNRARTTGGQKLGEGQPKSSVRTLADL